VWQPLHKILIDGKYQELLNDLVPLVEEELNIKAVEFVADPGQYMEYRLKPNFRVAGPALGPKIKEFGRVLANLDAATAAPKLEDGQEVSISLAGQELQLSKDLVEITITAREGFTVAMEDNLFVILDTTLTQDLIDEGFAREFVSKVQQLRKHNDYQVTDNIKVVYDGDEEVAAAVEVFQDYIMQETLAISIERVQDSSLERQNLNDHPTGIKTQLV